MGTVHSGHLYFAPLKRGVFDLLPYVEPGLMLDVGAAAGIFTSLMVAKSPTSRVVAFEPFPGNVPHFKTTVGDDRRVTLIQKAVSDAIGLSKFFVRSTVAGTEPGWETKAGYSSLGYLVDAANPRASEAIDVETTTIDEVINGEHVRFMKIDVQGGELGVLRSSRRAIASRRLDMIQVEHSGERDVMDFLQDAGFVIYDQEYQLIPTKPEPVDFSAWDVRRKFPLSTGRIGLGAWPRSIPREAEAYAAFMTEQRMRIGGVQTDLVCVAPHFHDEFLSIAASITNSHSCP